MGRECEEALLLPVCLFRFSAPGSLRAAHASALAPACRINLRSYTQLTAAANYDYNIRTEKVRGGMRGWEGSIEGRAAGKDGRVPVPEQMPAAVCVQPGLVHVVLLLFVSTQHTQQGLAFMKAPAVQRCA